MPSHWPARTVAMELRIITLSDEDLVFELEHLLVIADGLISPDAEVVVNLLPRLNLTQVNWLIFQLRQNGNPVIVRKSRVRPYYFIFTEQGSVQIAIGGKGKLVLPNSPIRIVEPICNSCDLERAAIQGREAIFAKLAQHRRYGRRRSRPSRQRTIERRKRRNESW